MNKLSVNRDGYTLNILDKRQGKSVPILVIGSAIYYQRLFSSPVYDDVDMVFIDHRGFSKSVESNAIFTLEDIVEDIEAVRLMLGIETMHVLGHSGHGFMAMAYADTYPNFVGTVILSNLAPTNSLERNQETFAYFETHASQDRRFLFEKNWATFHTVIEIDPENRFTHLNVAMVTHVFYDCTIDSSVLWKGVVNNMPALDYLWGDAFATYDTTGFFKRMDKEILLLLAKHDYLVAPTHLWTKLVFDNPNVTYGQFQYSGHNPMYEEPHRYRKYLDLVLD